MEKNNALFDELREFDLPIDKYIIGASGPMGIRNLREISDIDIKVTDDLWEELAREREIVIGEDGLLKIRLSSNVEVMCQKSFEGKSEDAPKIDDQLRNAEMIDGLPFENIQTLLYFKRLGTRDKDKRDVALIEGWLEHNN